MKGVADSEVLECFVFAAVLSRSGVVVNKAIPYPLVDVDSFLGYIQMGYVRVRSKHEQVGVNAVGDRVGGLGSEEERLVGFIRHGDADVMGRCYEEMVGVEARGFV